MTFGPKFTGLHSYPKERQLQKSCVSFGQECTGVNDTAGSSMIEKTKRVRNLCLLVQTPFWSVLTQNSRKMHQNGSNRA